jgi:hypothetical protein
VRPIKAIPIDSLTRAAEEAGGVRRSELSVGERVIVSTRNSVYSLTLRADGAFDASGGWFEREGDGPTSIEVLGCTAGGHAIFTELVAAPGLFLEFGDGLRTTRIRTVRRLADPEDSI